jgi:riboflavin kinase/FMN adenylyltransferase
VVVHPFDGALSRMSASEFIQRIVVERLNARYLVVGRDHQFGKDRSGDAQRLPEFAANSDLQVKVVDLKMLDRKISSSAIRRALTDGKLSSANEMLGYTYIITGKVVAGDRLGRTIGFPTANVETPAFKLLPKDGAYRVTVVFGNGEPERLGMMYVGKRPVLKQQDAATRVEVNIFDFDRDIYGQEVALAVTHRIRNDIRFAGVEQLIEQLHRDRQTVLRITP